MEITQSARANITIRVDLTPEDEDAKFGLAYEMGLGWVMIPLINIKTHIIDQLSSILSYLKTQNIHHVTLKNNVITAFESHLGNPVCLKDHVCELKSCLENVEDTIKNRLVHEARLVSAVVN